MKLQIDRIDQHALINFINRVKLIDSFIYMKLVDGRVNSTVYLPQRDAVKSHVVDINQIFQINEIIPSEKSFKIAFFDGAKVIEAIKHFEHDAIKGEIEFIENDEDYVASTFRIYNDELEVKLSCSEPSLGFKDLTSDQINAIFSKTGSDFSFEIDTHMINKVKNLFNLDSEETFNIKVNKKGAHITGKSFSVLINSESKGEGEVTVYKKYLNLLDKEEQTMYVSNSKVVFQSNDSETQLTVSTCQTA